MLLVEPVFLIVSSRQFCTLFRISSIIVVGEHLVLVLESIIAIELAGHAHSKEVRLILRVADAQEVVAIGCQILEGLQVVQAHSQGGVVAPKAALLGRAVTGKLQS